MVRFHQQSTNKEIYNLKLSRRLSEINSTRTNIPVGCSSLNRLTRMLDQQSFARLEICPPPPVLNYVKITKFSD